MVVFNLENNLKNAEFFRRYVIGARLNRGKNIPNRNIINFNVEKDPKIKVIADVQGSGSSRYVINIIEDENGFQVIHDCPDFKKGSKFCKHIVKILLLLETETCKIICNNYRNITFSSNFSLIKESKTKSYLLKAEELIKHSKHYEAINFLEHAYDESKNFDYIMKASEIALKYDLYDQIIKYSVEHIKLFEVYKKEYPRLVNSAIGRISQYNFSKKVEIITNIQKLLANFPKSSIIEVIKNSDIQRIKNMVLKYSLLHKFDPDISLKNHFEEFSLKKDSNLKTLIEIKAEEMLNEAILNMEPEEEINSFITIASFCNFSNYNAILSHTGEYKEKLKNIYLEALKLKHAYLRSLVITNTKTDKLKNMKFVEKYNFPTLVWTQPYRSEISLHYYILGKCGFESHHLEYITKDDFIENYPVFSSIFSGNNPIRHGVKSFWGTDNPKIINTAHNEEMVEVDFEINLNEHESLLLVEWDLAQSPILGSYICQFDDGYLIPDNNHPLTHEIQPFDLILCDSKPIAIKGKNIKIIRPIRRISVKTAIELVWGGLDIITSYLPLDSIRELKDYKIDEFDAYTKIDNVFNTSFLPNKISSQKLFQDFIRQKVLTELNNTYLKVINNPNYEQKVLNMIGFERYSRIFKNQNILKSFRTENLKRESLPELKLDFKNFVSKKITEIIQNKDFESIDLKTIRQFPNFRKWTAKIILELKNQLEKSKIYKIDKNKFDIRNILKNYYGRIIAKEVVGDISENKKIIADQEVVISENELFKINDNFKFLKLERPKITKKIVKK
ncbi:MAG: hypothetical protein ACW96X_00870 [Promethearchaeota archaeon]